MAGKGEPTIVRAPRGLKGGRGLGSKHGTKCHMRENKKPARELAAIKTSLKDIGKGDEFTGDLQKLPPRFLWTVL